MQSRETTLSQSVNETTSQSLRGQAVANQVLGRFRQDASLRHRDVTCEFYEGAIILRGHLPTYYLKQMAQTLAAQVAGVQQVDNRIEVSRLRRQTDD